jgi:hypothetical protein
VTLFESSNGIDYRPIVSWDIAGYPNETTLRFSKAGEMVALLRRDKAFDNKAWIGVSSYPYKEWTWHIAKHYFGGPNFVILDDGSFWAAGRVCTINPYGLFEKTVMASMEVDDLTPFLVLPSGGDTSYPGIVYQDGNFLISYYSSHESKTAIYLACVSMGDSS